MATPDKELVNDIGIIKIGNARFHFSSSFHESEQRLSSRDLNTTKRWNIDGEISVIALVLIRVDPFENP